MIYSRFEMHLDDVPSAMQTSVGVYQSDRTFLGTDRKRQAIAMIT